MFADVGTLALYDNSDDYATRADNFTTVMDYESKAQVVAENVTPGSGDVTLGKYDITLPMAQVTLLWANMT